MRLVPAEPLRVVRCALLAIALAAGPLACDDQPSGPPAPGGADASSNQSQSAGDPQLAGGAIVPEEVKERLTQLLGAAHRQDFEYLFAHSAGIQKQVEIMQRDHGAVEQFKAAQAAKFARGECDADLQELLNLLRPKHRFEIRGATPTTDFEHQQVRWPGALRCEVYIQYESPRQSPMFEGSLIKDAMLSITLEEPGGRYITSAHFRKRNSEWEQAPLIIYAVGSQPGSGELFLDVRLLGGTQPVNICLRGGSTVLWRRVREADRVGLMRQAKLVVPLRVAQEQWLPPSQWMLAAYDGAGEVQVAALSGGRWTPDDSKTYPESRIWWIAQPWRSSWQWNQLSGIFEAKARDLVLGLSPADADMREQALTAINEENSARERQRAGLKVTRESGRIITQFTVVPNAWSIPFHLPPNASRWELDTGQKPVEVLLSNGERIGWGSRPSIDIPPDGSVYFKAVENAPVEAKFIVIQGGE